MPAPKKYPEEMRERSVRLVLDLVEGEEQASVAGACARVGQQLGIDLDTLRGWVKQAQIDAGSRAGTTTSERDRIKALGKENAELRRANAILKTASAFFAAGARPPDRQQVIDDIDAHRDQFGVEPICRVLAEHGVPIAPSSYRAAKARPLLLRALRDAALSEVLVVTFFDREKGRGVYGARKMWHQLRRDRVTGADGQPVARCTVERLMRSLGLRGARRGASVITTRSDKSSTCAPDLVERDFRASAPNRLWVVDFTYVPTWSGMVFTAFVSDVYSRRIVGWRTAASMPTELPLDALEMALWTRQAAGHSDGGRLLGLVHHSDAGCQYTAVRYGNRMADAGVIASIGSVGDSYDNALAESVIGLYKTECVRRDGPRRTVDDLELATLSWVHWFNIQRLHTGIGNIPPVEAEETYYRQQAAREHPLSGELSRH